MSENSKIEWTHHTFNPWWGCTKIGPGCDNCYAATFDHRLGGDHWGAGKPRREFGAKHWNEPYKWNREAAKLGIRYRVFCASMADVFDNEIPQAWRERLWELIEQTPHLDWLLLTKRIGNVLDMIPGGWCAAFPPNVWMGATIVTQQEADRDLPKILRIPARIRFLSMEPLLESVDLCWRVADGEWDVDPLTGKRENPFDDIVRRAQGPRLHWVIVGGESGHGARPFVLGYGKDIVRQCKNAGVPVFVKQVGSYPTNREGERCPHIKDPKGGNMAEWPEELRVREFPT